VLATALELPFLAGTSLFLVCFERIAEDGSRYNEYGEFFKHFLEGKLPVYSGFLEFFIQWNRLEYSKNLLICESP
jgi:hypothetical protein